jgi:mannose-6-phosphate isomerase-like protein (cupin superfamily)
MMKSYSIATADGARTEFHETLGLTWAELSVNNLPAWANVPFVHSHKENEEIYIILDGRGNLSIDWEDVEIKKWDIIRISPNGKRQFSAATDSWISYVCIQVKENSLTQYTANDAVIEQ